MLYKGYEDFSSYLPEPKNPSVAENPTSCFFIASNKKVKLKLKEFKPDYVYVHNTWFMANLGIFKVLKKENIKPIIKLHNFRFLCTNTFRSTKHLRNQKFCSMCGFKQNNLGFNMLLTDVVKFFSSLYTDITTEIFVFDVKLLIIL